jgi:hypothetical protein
LVQNKCHIIVIICQIMISFLIPFSMVFIIYIVILRRAIRSSLNVHQSWRPIRRDVELLRNILIIYKIFLFSELPTVIYLILSMRKVRISTAFYMFAAAASPISTTLETILIVFNHWHQEKPFIQIKFTKTLSTSSNKLIF